MACTLLALSLGFAASSFAAEAKSISERAAQDETVDMSEEEPAMRQAMAKARATLDEFLAKAHNPVSHTHGYALKVAVTDGGNTEYFWVSAFSATDKQFRGVLNNEPRLVKKYQYGETITFERKQIVDWTYSDTNKRRMYGNYTACALLTKEPPEEAAQFKKEYGLQCD